MTPSPVAPGAGQRVGRGRRIAALFPSRGQLRAHRIDLLLAGLSGLAGAFVFADANAWWLAWFCLAPYLWVLPRTRGRMTVWVTLVFGFLWNYTGLWWLNTLVFFNPFIPVGIPLLALMLSLLLLPFAFAAAHVMRRLPAAPAALVVGALWTGVEFARTFGDIAFPWNFIGHSQAPMPDVIQSADVWGVFGISFLVVSWNAALAGLFWRHDGGVRPRGERAVTAAGVLALAAMLGWALGVYPEARLGAIRAGMSEDGGPRFALIQPNISQVDKWTVYDEATGHDRRMQIEIGIVERHFALMSDAGQTTPTPSLYLLPEAAFVSPFFVYDTRLQEIIGQAAANLQADVLFGADRREPLDDYLRRRSSATGSPGRESALPVLVNAAADDGTTHSVEPGPMASFASAWFASAEDGLTSSVYDKIRLVPFGETAPILGAIPGLQEHIMMVGSFQSGLDQTIFETTGARFGVMICFESTFADLARGIAAQGGDFIAVITNDAWYSPDYSIQKGGVAGLLFRLPGLAQASRCGPGQHFVHSVFRAVETRLPVLRTANTGISAVIGPDGTVRQKLGFFEQGYLVDNLPRTDAGGRTPYVRHGDWFAAVCLGVLGLVLLWQAVSSWRGKRKAAPPA